MSGLTFETFSSIEHDTHPRKFVTTNGTNDATNPNGLDNAHPLRVVNGAKFVNGAEPPHAVNGNGIYSSTDLHAKTLVTANGANGVHYASGLNETSSSLTSSSQKGHLFTPIAICGMSCRLPGGIGSPEQLWEFLLQKGDATTKVPKSRYNVDAYYSPTGKPGFVNTQRGCFLENDLANLDTSFFTMSVGDLASCDPQQRQLLEVARECIDDAGEMNWRGTDIGVYVGNFGEDWYDMYERELYHPGFYRINGTADFALANRVSYEMDLQGPSMTIRTGCSAALIGLNEACMAIGRGDCKSAIVGGTNLILAPNMTIKQSDQGVSSPDGSCKTFSANANGYGRGEAISAIFVKRLDEALRDGNPVRAVIRGAATNSDGKTPGLTTPSAEAQETLIRRAYKLADIHNFADTGFFECHGTGTPTGDPIETRAVARVFGDHGIHIGSVKPNVGHSEGASGITSVIKAVMALEKRTIPPNIKFEPPHPKIPFEAAGLVVPGVPTPWPESRKERVSVNSFGVGGSNAHVILDSARSFNASNQLSESPYTSQLLLFSAKSEESLKRQYKQYADYIERYPERIADLAYTLANRREHHPYRAFVVGNRESIGNMSPVVKGGEGAKVVMVFTGQGAQWPRMGRELMSNNKVFKNAIKQMDAHLRTLASDDLPIDWTIEEELLKPAKTSRISAAQISQPLCTAIQVALVDVYASLGVKPEAVVGHSSGEIAAAYAAGALTANEAIAVAFYRGLVAREQTRAGSMAAIGLGWNSVRSYLRPGVAVGCDNSPNSVTLTGDSTEIQAVVEQIKDSEPGVLATILKVDKAYHSSHMKEVGTRYHGLIAPHLKAKPPNVPFFSSLYGKLLEQEQELGAQYWQENLESPVLFCGAVASIAKAPIASNAILLEVGPHSALAGPLRQILLDSGKSATPYISSMIRNESTLDALLSALGKLYNLKVAIDFSILYPHGTCLPGLPTYAWNHTGKVWHETRVTREWRQRQHRQHGLLGAKVLESSDLEPAWRNVLYLDSVPWIRDHRVENDALLPFAAYVCMAGEAVRQLTGIEEGFTVRNVLVHTGVIVADESVELITNLKRHRLTTSQDSLWWEFSIQAHNGNNWINVCSGQVSSRSTPIGKANALPVLPRKMKNVGEGWYNMISKRGLTYGPHFQKLEDVCCSTTDPAQSTAAVKNMRNLDEDDYFLHPVIIDASLQLMNIASASGVSRKLRNLLATSCTEMDIYRCADDMSVLATAVTEPSGVLRGSAENVANGMVVLRITDQKSMSLESATADSHAAARHVWNPDVDFLSMENLFAPSSNQAANAPALDKLTDLCILYNQGASSESFNSQTPHLEQYHKWLGEMAAKIKDQAADIKMPSLETVREAAQQLRDTPAASVAELMLQVCDVVPEALRGNRNDFDSLFSTEIFTKAEDFINELNMGEFLKSLHHSKPNLTVLHLGAKTGETAATIVKQLKQRFSKYFVTDTSSGYLLAAQERFQNMKNVDVVPLDIAADLAEQGLGDQTFDLIIAADVLPVPLGKAALENIRKLLRSDGRLLVEEPKRSEALVSFIFGLLPKWWERVAEEISSSSSISMLDQVVGLENAGFQSANEARICSSRFNTAAIIQPKLDKLLETSITILCRDKNNPPVALSKELQSRGFSTIFRTLDEIPIKGENIIATLDDDDPFLDNVSLQDYQKFKDLTKGVVDSGSLFWITKSVFVDCKNPRFAEIVGLARTLRSELDIDFAVCQTEHGSSEGNVVDVFEKFHRRRQDGALKPEMEYAIINGQVNVGRFYPFSLPVEMLINDENDNVVLTVGKPARIVDMRWLREKSGNPEDNEVEVEVYSAGLNFRDVLTAAGLLTISEPWLGWEAAGIVRRCGPTVKTLKVGDRVIVGGHKGFSARTIQSEMKCIRMPDDLTFDEGATMGLVYCTAINALMDVGNLQAGQSILIHSACGGVGLAAIQIAKMIGAEIYTSVGNEEKVKYLMDTFSIPRNRIFHSRDASFVDDLLRETDGKGVDLVLNQLGGELLHATWRHCVAEFGKMVEIGKRDLVGVGKLDMDVFLKNRSYLCADSDGIFFKRLELMHRQLSLMMEYYKQGFVRPIEPVKKYKADEIQQAFRYMQQGVHIGKIIIQMRDPDGKVLLPPSEISPRKLVPEYNSQASYLLIGGLGGLGRAVSTWMMEHGARHFLFIGRSAGDNPEDQAFAEELKSAGCTVQLIKGSVTNMDDVRTAIQKAEAPLKGIMQMSMVLRDASWENMSYDDWKSAMDPKVQGSWNLHNVCVQANINLDFFVLFSSISGVIGNVGQANYASANTFLDSFCQYRNSHGLAASCIDIGAIEDVGVLSGMDRVQQRMKQMGFSTIKEEHLLDALVLATSADFKSHNANAMNNFVLGLASNMSLKDPNNRTIWRKDPRMAVYHNEDTRAKEKGSADSSNLKRFLAEARSDPSILDMPDSLTLMSGEIGRRVAGFLMVDPAELDATASLADIGVDSLLAMELRAWWKRTLAVEINTVELLGLGTLENLGKHAIKQLKALAG